MAIVMPFKALRPSNKYANRLPALPYDVYSREEAYQEVQRCPESFLAIDRPETAFAPDYDMYADEVYQKAADILNEWIDEGRFVEDQTARYYIYELTMNDRTQTGIVGCASIDDYLNGVIKKHENTRSEKEIDRIKHVDVCNAQTGPIFLAYRSNMMIDNMVQYIKHESPIYEATFKDGVTHKIWPIANEADVISISECFENTESIYIADGHHRCASAVKVGLKRREENPDYTGKEEFNYFLSVLFPDNELMIMDYNRVVKDLNGLSSSEFFKQVSEFYQISEPMSEQIKPSKKGEVTMYIDGKWYKLTMKPFIKSYHPVEGLDVSILQKYVLGRILGINDPKTDKRIDFVGGIRGLDELERRVNDDSRVAFAMYPTSIEELFAVADEGLLMPPKSTWFEPKLRSGLFIHRI